MAIRLTEELRGQVAAAAVPMSPGLKVMIDAGRARIVGDARLVAADDRVLGRGYAYREGDGEPGAEIICEVSGIASYLAFTVEGRAGRVAIPVEVLPGALAVTVGVRSFCLADDPEPETWRDRPAML